MRAEKGVTAKARRWLQVGGLFSSFFAGRMSMPWHLHGFCMTCGASCCAVVLPRHRPQCGLAIPSESIMLPNAD